MLSWDQGLFKFVRSLFGYVVSPGHSILYFNDSCAIHFLRCLGPSTLTGSAVWISLVLKCSILNN